MELSEEFEVRQKTCWEFKWKVEQAMRSSFRYPLEGKVHVDEFFIGGEENVIGREKGKKRLVIIALEVVSDGVVRAYAENIKDDSSRSIKPFFEKYIDKDAEVIFTVFRIIHKVRRLRFIR